MKKQLPHTFHIPVMGIGFTIDTPLKVGKFGISSVVSIMDDQLIEQIRKKYCLEAKLPYVEISDTDEDSRASRITAYLNLLDILLKEQITQMKEESFTPGTNLYKYFELLPTENPDRILFESAILADDSIRESLFMHLREKIIPGSIDVNIMTKLDKTNYNKAGEPLAPEFSDAMACLRGFANSTVSSAVIFSAGLNPRLYSYCASFSDFFPDQNEFLKKRIILKVSDYRSALVQGKFLAKKGLWVSEFRIESGLNCGGHVFATDGILIGPILEEFKEKRKELYDELLLMCNDALIASGKSGFEVSPELRVTVQGGIGTHIEHEWLLQYYNLDSTGWGSPFLLVPEACNIDTNTLQKLSVAKPDDYYRSNASPLGIPFSNFRLSGSEEQRKIRIEKNRPGSPCYKKLLSFDKEFSPIPICTGSRLYQDLKIKQAKELYPDKVEYDRAVARIVEKDCLCEGLGASALLVNDLPVSHNLNAVAVCPGPNLAYFSGIFTLQQMVDHIYGRNNCLNTNSRPHVFLNELKLYIDYLRDEWNDYSLKISGKKESYFQTFRENLFKGISYYKELVSEIKFDSNEGAEQFMKQIMELEQRLSSTGILQLNPI